MIMSVQVSPLWREVSFVVLCRGNKCVQRQASRSGRMILKIHFGKRQTQKSQTFTLSLLSSAFAPHHSSSFSLLLPTLQCPLLYHLQVNETTDIITWQPPAEPNGITTFLYQVRVGEGREQLVVVPEVMETRAMTSQHWG